MERGTGKEKTLTGKVAIITGAARGIGKGIALEFARNGAAIVIADIDKEGSEKTQKELGKQGVSVFNSLTDISNDEQNKRLVDQVLEKFGRVDILVNNAGINIPYWGLLEKRDKQEDKSVFTTNLIGPFFLTKRVAQEMVARKIKGNIIFISSIHSHVTQLHPAYTSTKAAIEMFVRDLALELAPHGIRVHAIAPGAISISGEIDPRNDTVPMGFSGMPQDIANAALFLVSDKAHYITGQTLVVDGGLSLTHVFWERWRRRES